MQSNTENPKIAYFSMEMGIRSDIPTYSGGLGILAGAVIRSSADLRVPTVGLTLVSRKGYLKQKITETGEQQEFPDEWQPERTLELSSQSVNLTIQNRNVKIQARGQIK